MKWNASTLISVVSLLVATSLAFMYFNRHNAIVREAVTGQKVAPVFQAGDMIQWTSTDGAGFSIRWVNAHPCQETSFHGTGSTPVTCTVKATDGQFQYQIFPDGQADLPSPTPLDIVIKPCKPCKG
jgi:hypothetical protein